MVFGADESLKKTPGAASHNARHLYIFRPQKFSFGWAVLAYQISDYGRENPENAEYPNTNNALGLNASVEPRATSVKSSAGNMNQQNAAKSRLAGRSASAAETHSRSFFREMNCL